MENRKIKLISDSKDTQIPSQESFFENKRIGDLFAQERIKSQISLTEIAEYLEIDIPLLIQYEIGRKQIPLSHIYSLSNRLNIDPNIILNVFISKKRDK